MKFSHLTPDKALATAWIRKAAMFIVQIQDMEAEIARMKERKVHQEIIDRKDLQVENLVNFYNDTDELMQMYKLTQANLRIENHFLTEMLASKITVDELIKYKPSARTIIENMETGNAETLTSING